MPGPTAVGAAGRASLSLLEAQSRAAQLQVHLVEVELDLTDPLADTFGSRTTIHFASHGPETFVDFAGASLGAATLNGRPLDPGSWQRGRIPLTGLASENTLVVEGRMAYSSDGEGLHRHTDPVDGRSYLYAMSFLEAAPRWFACFDQPDLKARYAFDVLAPDEWTVLGNGPAQGGRGRWRIEPPHPLSTYFVTLVAGPYASVLAEHDGIRLGLHIRQSLRAELEEQAPDMLEVTAASFDYYHRVFGIRYPFGEYHQAFVPEFNAGAMENPGCVTFRDGLVPRGRVTRGDRLTRAAVIAHEMAHQWFGDLVTMRWWDDLWLKESFATWSSNFAVSEQADDPTLNWATFNAGSKTMAARADQLPSTHPIAADIVDLEAVEYNFDQITYGKGASVLVQLVAFVGRDAFLEGVRAYFAEHAYGNTSLGDLLSALEPPSGRDLSSWSKLWLETAGINTLRMELETDADDRVTAATIHQSAPAEHPTLRPHRLAVGSYAEQDGRLVRISRVEQDVDGEATPVPGLVGQPRPALVLLNDGDLTFAKIRLDPRSLQTAREHLPQVDDALTRAVIWGSLWDSCRDAELPARDYADVVLRTAPAESVSAQLRNVLVQAGLAVHSYTAPAERATVSARWEAGLSDQLASAGPASDEQLALARAYAAAANPGRGADVLAGWLTGEGVPEGLTLDRDLRWLVLGQLARLGRTDETGIADEQRRDASNTGAELAAGVRASLPSAAAKAEAWRLATETDEVSNATQQSICLGFWQRGQDEVLMPYVERYLAMAEDASALRGAWATKGIALRTAAIRYLFPVPADREPFLRRLDAWLETAELSSSVLRIVRERRDDSLRALRCQQGAE